MYPVVYFDLETTGLSRYNAGVIQIGAKSGSYSFSAFMVPQVPIEQGATNVHGMTSFQGRLYRKNQMLPTVSQRQAYVKFLDFLRSFQRPVILVAHNGHNFDVPLLVRDMQQEGLLGTLRQAVAGTVDSMDVFRAKLSHWNANNLGLTTVAAQLGVPNYGAHDALRDAEMLEGVCARLVSPGELWSTPSSSLIEDRRGTCPLRCRVGPSPLFAPPPFVYNFFGINWLRFFWLY